MSQKMNYFGFGINFSSEIPLPLVQHTSLGPFWTVTKDIHTIHSIDETCFLESEAGKCFIDLKKNTICIDLHAQNSPQSRASFFSDWVMLQTLSLLGRICLRGSAIAYKGKAYGFIGSPEVGKSNLTALLLKKGAQLISDGMLPLQETPEAFHAIPTVPFFKLRKEAAEYFSSASQDAEKAVDAAGKFSFNSTDSFALSPVPLSKLFIVEDTKKEEEISTTFFDVTRNILRPSIQSPADQNANFEAAETLVNHHWVQPLSLPKELHEMELFVDFLIESDFGIKEKFVS